MQREKKAGWMPKACFSNPPQNPPPSAMSRGVRSLHTGQQRTRAELAPGHRGWARGWLEPMPRELQQRQVTFGLTSLAAGRKVRQWHQQHQRARGALIPFAFTP